jgi:hypothetical protein
MSMSKNAANRILTMSGVRAKSLQSEIQNAHGNLQNQISIVENTKRIIGELNDEMEDLNELCALAHDVLNQEDGE